MATPRRALAKPPAGARQPADRKPKAAAEVEVEVEVVVDGEVVKRKIPARRVTVKGLELTVEERRMNDYRVVRLMAESRKGDALSTVDVLEGLLGAEQHNQVVESLADADGFVDQYAVAEFIMELFKALSPN